METKRFDVVALGELLIDFTENGLSGQGNALFEANPGGAPCNVLEHGLDGLTADNLTEMLQFANTAAYLVTTRKGAIRSMPERSDVIALL